MTDQARRPHDLPTLDLDLLPCELSRLAREVGETWGVDPALAAAPGLAVLGAAAGGNVALHLPGAGFTAWPLLWVAVIARTGRGKTPMADHALRPLRDAEEELDLAYARLFDEWKTLPPKVRATTPKPAPRRLTVSDSTFERAVMLNSDNRAGLLWVRDELPGIFSQLRAYRSGEGITNFRESDLLSMWNRVPLRRDRVGDFGDYVAVPHPFIAITGGIQPIKLPTLGDNGDGRLGRILVYWAEDRVPELRRGYDLSPTATGDWNWLVRTVLDHRESSASYQLRVDAQDVWHEQLAERGRRLREAEPGLEDELLSKVDQHAGRLISVLHHAATHGIADDACYVPSETVRRGWRLAWIFHAHQLAAYQTASDETSGLSESQRTVFDAVNALDRLVRDAGGRVRRRDAQRRIGPLRWRRPAEFSALVREWVGHGLGEEIDETTPDRQRTRVLVSRGE